MKYLTVVGSLVIVCLVCQLSLVAAFGPQGLNTAKLTEWKVINSSLGGSLLLSDSPEMVMADGILYQDTVTGNIRLFFYHVNAMADARKIDVLLENKVQCQML